jgi:hypothetical protein
MFREPSYLKSALIPFILDTTVSINNTLKYEGLQMESQWHSSVLQNRLACT